MESKGGEMYVTDKQIIEETDKLMASCIEFADKNCQLWDVSNRSSIAITRFLYLKDKLFNHPTKYQREQQIKPQPYQGRQ